MTGHQPLVALVHATPASMAPAAASFAEAFPQARLWNLLDDTLISDAERAGRVTEDLRVRMRALIGYAVDGGADAVQLTCSMYGPVAHEVADRHPVPVLASDGALFDEVARRAPRRALVLGPIEAGTRDTVSRLQGHVGARTVVHGAVVAGAREALAAGSVAEAARLVSAAARGAEAADLVVLGQFSLAPTHDAAQADLDVALLSPAHLAAQALRSAIG
ncbi:aspartate/glutamate racemase family protein [Pseudonocardia sp. MH-G8]|uniref:aspartate/glutamate racemase family protein n=1 Tax=Pseudonocardia sp. MH-G8 TaxID=1854588 RepID=UPI000BA07658|nr:aspartate/glutamate racemase family protein [Pseudonocardia sp. MH-G8]OZM78849.1 hypothetical protein CFP66_28205 [Pseudonocardia sp. MH-G8]